jgi:hypothetical protein
MTNDPNWRPPASKEFRIAVAIMQASLFDLSAATNFEDFQAALDKFLHGTEALHESISGIDEAFTPTAEA